MLCWRLTILSENNITFSSGAYSVTHGRLGQGSGPVVLDALSCTGQENFLGQCRHNPAGAVLCQPSQTLGIVCAAGEWFTPISDLAGYKFFLRNVDLEMSSKTECQ